MFFDKTILHKKFEWKNYIIFQLPPCQRILKNWNQELEFVLQDIKK